MKSHIILVTVVRRGRCLNNTQNECEIVRKDASVFELAAILPISLTALLLVFTTPPLNLIVEYFIMRHTL